MSAVTFDDTFSSFIDHYILLLAARFKAPLDVVLQDDLPNYGCTAAEAHSRWDLVARCVRDELEHPRTVQERQNVKHLDVFFFTGDVCRERALYLQWKMQSRDAGKARSAPATAAGTSPSSFDITSHSITARVANIFADVRRNLPSALLDGDDDEDQEDDDLSGDQRRGAASRADRARETLSVRDVFVRTEEEKKRDDALARARDNLLSQVQSLQAAFYEQHRRWIEVPYEALAVAPPAASEPAETLPSASAAVAKRQSEEVERAELLAALRSDAGRTGRTGAAGSQASPLERLRQTVHVDRPARPSAMTDSAIASMHQSAAEAGSRAEPTRAASLLKETAAPAGRHQRWQIMEYEDDTADGSEDDGDT